MAGGRVLEPAVRLIIIITRGLLHRVASMEVLYIIHVDSFCVVSVAQWKRWRLYVNNS